MKKITGFTQLLTCMNTDSTIYIERNGVKFVIPKQAIFRMSFKEVLEALSNETLYHKK